MLSCLEFKHLKLQSFFEDRRRCTNLVRNHSYVIIGELSSWEQICVPVLLKGTVLDVRAGTDETAAFCFSNGAVRKSCRNRIQSIGLQSSQRKHQNKFLEP